MDRRITEQPSTHRHLENKSIQEITKLINSEDQKVAPEIERILPAINNLVEEIVNKLNQQGRVFYVGAGSGGRLAVLDVIELPTTYGIEKGIFNIILAGGIERLHEALEEKEDDKEAGWQALQASNINSKDIVIGISASGTTPFVLHTLGKCQLNGITTGCIVSNPNSPIAKNSNFPIEIITGPEFITGSTRMKCGTAQKMIFDIISTTTMIKLNRVEDNAMVNVALINDKIINRAVNMLMRKSNLADFDQAKELLIKEGSVKKALDFLKQP